MTRWNLYLTEDFFESFGFPPPKTKNAFSKEMTSMFLKKKKSMEFTATVMLIVHNIYTWTESSK